MIDSFIRHMQPAITYIFTTDEPMPTVPPEECDPPCKIGECCMANKCWCLNTTTMEMNECQG